MKKTIITIALLMGVLVSTAQKKYATYSEGEISVVTTPGKSQGMVYMNVSSESGLVLTKNKRIKFLEFVSKCYDKATEWDSIAKANNILDMSSKSYGNFNVSGYFDYGGWRFGSTTMKLMFYLEEGETKYYLYMGKMTANNNQFMKSEPVLFALTDTLLSELKTLLSEDAINEFVTSENKTESLFD